jgi:hypothetical protein
MYLFPKIKFNFSAENVAELAALADRFQASGVAKSCALHLMSYAVEIPFIDRLYIAQRFRLAGVCVGVLHALVFFYQFFKIYK